jgi:RND family efflux transporter MFP subunit
MMAVAPDELHKDLHALRLERGTVLARPRRRLRWLITATVLLAIAGLIGRRIAAGRVPQVEVAPVTVSPAGARDGVPVLSGAGYVVSADRYISIGVRVAGRIDRYLVEEGTRVSAGDALVELDAREYRATVERAAANMKLAQAEAVLAKQKRVRAETLFRTGVVSKEELDIRRAEDDTAAAKIGTAKADLDAARVALEYTTLRAPRSGVILAKLKEVGEIAVPGGFSGSGDLIRMANLEDLRGQVDVTEAELAKIRMGQRAEVVPDAYPDRRYPAHVVKLYPQVDKQKGTLRIEVQIEKPDENLWPDMSARITFLEPVQGAPGAAVVLVPRSAVRQSPQGTYAWVLDGDRVRRTPVTTGPEFADQVQVTAGLAGRERVVIGDTPPLQDGQQVREAARA